MMKKFSVLSLVVSGAMIFSFAGFGCKKAEQTAEAPKQAEQAQAPTPVAVADIAGFKVTDGRLEKGGLGYVLSSDKDKMAVAMKKTDMPYKNIVTIKGQIKAAVSSGPRNGFIYVSAGKQMLKAGILIAAKSLSIEGSGVQKVEKAQKFDQNKVFDTELVINLKEKTVTLKVDGTEVKTKMTARPDSINYIGYANWSTKTEFSEPQISGE